MPEMLHVITTEKSRSACKSDETFQFVVYSSKCERAFVCVCVSSPTVLDDFWQINGKLLVQGCCSSFPSRIASHILSNCLLLVTVPLTQTLPLAVKRNSNH